MCLIRRESMKRIKSGRILLIWLVLLVFLLMSCSVVSKLFEWGNDHPDRVRQTLIGKRVPIPPTVEEFRQGD